ncbi:condensation domain-containing protein [Rhizobium sp. AAP43]|uniref:condensation domain-containing protein n=1 Tax=Rhizobium sp. AAP43 TaxID=1523420 RepID=UPI0006B90C31|nr:condensation domain-containing protein [Rhizobium sp. AAP43]
MSAEAQRAMSHAHDQQNLSGTEGVTPANLASLPPRMTVPSDHEEHVWLQQMQDPDGIFRHLIAYRIAGNVDIVGLAESARELARRWSPLDSRYRFEDSGQLLRLNVSKGFDAIEILRADTLADAARQALALQAKAFDPERDAPFKLLLILCSAETLLVLLTHRLIEALCPPETILRGLGAAYARRPLPELPAPKATGADHPSEGSPIAWLRRADITDVVVSSMHDDASAEAAGPIARRYSAVLPRKRLTGPVATETEPMRLLAALGPAFARFVALLGGHPEIDLELSRDPEASLGEPGLGCTAATSTVIPIHTNRPLTEAQDAILSGEAQTPHSASPGPRVSVTWLSDPNPFFAVPDVTLHRLPLPTLIALPDLGLGITTLPDGNLLLELTTGQALSSNAGAFLLERFVIALNDPALLDGQSAISMMATPLATAPSNAPAKPNDPAKNEAQTIEALILAAFREALGMPDMSATDDFFDQGGHSLIATRIIGRLLGNHGIEVHFNDLFSHPTAASLALHARRVDAANHGLPETQTDSTDSRRAPLSLAQMSLWKAYAAFGFNEIFNIPFALDFLDPVDERVFECAFLDILERHPGLRTLFHPDGDTVFQEVVPMYDIPDYRWFWTSDESIGVERNAEAGHHFDLARELPIRLRFLKDPECGRQTLSFLFHHIVLDEWSVNLMMDELVDAYRARSAGQVPQWATQPAPFHEFARKQHQAGVNAEHLAYWTDMLRDAPTSLPVLGSDGKQTADAEAGPSSAAGGWVEFKLDRTVTEGLYATARDMSASLFNVAYAAIAASLFRLGGVKDLVVGTSASGRIDQAYFDTVGYFTTVVAHRLRFDPSTTAGDLITMIKNTVNGSLPHSEIPIDLIEEALGMTPGRDHLFEVFIQIHAKNKLNGVLQSADGRTIEFRQVDPERHESLLGLHFEVMEEMIGGERSIRVLMSYRADHYGPEQVENIRTTTRDMFACFATKATATLPVSALLATA